MQYTVSPGPIITLCLSPAESFLVSSDVVIQISEAGESTGVPDNDVDVASIEGTLKRFTDDDDCRCIDRPVPAAPARLAVVIIHRREL